MLSRIVKLSNLMSRPPEEILDLDKPWNILAKSAVFLIALVFALGAMGYYFHKEVGKWDQAIATVPIKRSDWKVLYSDSPVACKSDERKGTQCPASPLNPILWSSSFNRADPEHSAKTWRRSGKTFWVGARINSENLASALDAEANRLMIYKINAGSRIWIDGLEIYRGTGRDFEAILLHLPFSSARIADPLYVAIEVNNNLGSAFPDYFGGPMGEGLFTTGAAEAYLRKYVFIDRVQFFGIFVVSAGIAILFFFFWVAAVKKQEYFYLAIFALAHSFYVGHHVSPTPFSREQFYLIDYFALSVFGSIGLLLALSFSRVRRSVTLHAFVPIFVFPFMVLLWRPSPETLTILGQIAAMWVNPLLFIVGGTVCVLQAMALRIRRVRATFSPTRIRRLICFGAVMYLIAGLYFWSGSGIASNSSFAHLYNFAFLGLIFTLAATVISEYREQELILSKTYVSSFHKVPTLPAHVYGALLEIDLVKSVRVSAELGPGGFERFSNRFVDVMSDCVADRQGHVLRDGGDSLTALFIANEGRERDPSCSVALGVVQEMSRRLLSLKDEFQLSKPLCLRASFSRGKVHPIWKLVGNERRPAWNGDLFVEVSRLLEIEKELRKPNDLSTNLVLEQDLALEMKLENLSPLEVVDKDGKGRKVVLLSFRPACEAVNCNFHCTHAQSA